MVAACFMEDSHVAGTPLQSVIVGKAWMAVDDFMEDECAGRTAFLMPWQNSFGSFYIAMANLYCHFA